MFNVMLDPLPTTWNGKEIETSYRIGIQVSQCLSDEDLVAQERIKYAARLIFTNAADVPKGYEAQAECIGWYLNGWVTDNVPSKGGDIKVMDFDVDQWRIYAAFKDRYGIDLNKEDLHTWVFMGLLHNIEECAYTRVINIRQKKIDSKLSTETKKALREAKAVYSLQKRKEEKTEQDIEAIELFNRLRKGV